MKATILITSIIFQHCCNAVGTAPVTLVTVYFPLRHSKHSHKEYTRWMGNFLSISSHIVVFTSIGEDIAHMRHNNRDRTLVLTKYNSTFDIPCIKHHKNSYNTWQHEIDPEKLTHSPALYGIWNSKVCLVNEVADLNPFKSEYFMWVDIGSFRSKSKITKWPNQARVSHVFSYSKDSMLFFVVSPPRGSEQESSNGDYVEGTFYGGSIKAIKDYYDAFWKVHDKMLGDNMFAGKDQNIMNVIVRKRLVNFILIHSYNHCINGWFYFQQFFAYDSEIDKSCYNEVVDITHWDGHNETTYSVDILSEPNSTVAYGIFLENDRYISGAITIASSIKKYANAHKSYGMIAMYTELGDRAKCVLTEAGWELHKVDIIVPFKEGVVEQFKGQYTKLSLWGFDQYTLIMYIDCDILIRRPVDFLFDLMAEYELGVVGDSEPNSLRLTFNAGMMILRPDKGVLSSFIAEGPTLDYDPGMAEQAFLNAWYRERVIRFPYVYSLNMAFINFENNEFIWNGLVAESYMIHFTMCKPMLTSDCGTAINDIWKESQAIPSETNC